jgi:hypothetical protein
MLCNGFCGCVCSMIQNSTVQAEKHRRTTMTTFTFASGIGPEFTDFVDASILHVQTASVIFSTLLSSHSGAEAKLTL